MQLLNDKELRQAQLRFAMAERSCERSDKARPGTEVRSPHRSQKELVE